MIAKIIIAIIVIAVVVIILGVIGFAIVWKAWSELFREFWGE